MAIITDKCQVPILNNDLWKEQAHDQNIGETALKTNPKAQVARKISKLFNEKIV